MFAAPLLSGDCLLASCVVALCCYVVVLVVVLFLGFQVTTKNRATLPGFRCHVFLFVLFFILLLESTNH